MSYNNYASKSSALLVDERCDHGQIRVVVRHTVLPVGQLFVGRDLIRQRWLETARLMKIRAYYIHMFEIVCAKPYVDRLGGKAAVGKRKYGGAARL